MEAELYHSTGPFELAVEAISHHIANPNRKEGAAVGQMPQIKVDAALGWGCLLVGSLGLGSRTHFGLLRPECIAGVLLHIDHGHHRPFQLLFDPLRFAVVEPVQPVGVTATFLGKGTIAYRDPGAVGSDYLFNQNLIYAF